MAKFCSQCGRPLQEGEVCTCQMKNQAPQGQPNPAPQGQPNQAPQGQPYQYQPGQPRQYQQGQPQHGAPQGQPYGGGQYQQGQPQHGGPQGQPYGGGQYQQGQPQYGGPQGQPYGGGQYQQGQPYGGPQYQQGQPYGGPQAPKQPSAAGVYMKGLWGTLIDSYKKPAGTLANMAAAPKTGVVLGICGIQTVFFALIFLFFGMKINGLTGGFYKVVNTPLTFFMALIAGAGILAVWGALVMLLARGMAKKQMSYMQGLGVAAAKAAAQLPFTVVTVFFALVMPLANQWTYIIILLVYSAGNLLAYFFIPAAMDAFCADDRNKRIWQLFVTFVVNFAATYLIAYIFAKIIGTDIVNMLQMF